MANRSAEPRGQRFFIEDVYPSVDGGRFAVKRIAGERIDVWADILREGHDIIAATLRWRREDDDNWASEPMQAHSNDRYFGFFVPEIPGRYHYAIEAWTDLFSTWRRDAITTLEKGGDIASVTQDGLALLRDAMPRDARSARVIEQFLDNTASNGDLRSLLDERLTDAMRGAGPQTDLSDSQTFPLIVQRPRARAGAWYEMFPRSQSAVAGRHGTFEDCAAAVPQIAALGFDVLYFPPIHPIGLSHRKGRNNSLTAAPDDPGSAYAIGSADGGHDAVHPELGTLEQFRRLVATCEDNGMEIALDFAIQCSPDHPWIKQHPQWFKWRADGTVRYAENPPKKYEDIVNPDLFCADRDALWAALRDVVLFWITQGVRIFRVDNPHTKAFPFWEWLIREVQTQHADIVFLSEAFTRPKIMKLLAKLGFSQSYTYFTWRTHKTELTEYLLELTRYPEREFFQPNFFVNTPDILPYHLQGGERWMFQSRVALAATLSSSYGIYSGFELLEHAPLEGKEEYSNSEKYELKQRDWNAPGNITDYIKRLNAIRRDNTALLQTKDLRFLATNNDAAIGFIKQSAELDNVVAAAIALQPGRHEIWLHFGDIKIGPQDSLMPVRSIVNQATGERHYLEWGGVRLYIDTEHDPALLFRCEP
jgi:starch synthase (maltosyl-transferring)